MSSADRAASNDSDEESRFSGGSVEVSDAAAARYTAGADDSNEDAAASRANDSNVDAAAARGNDSNTDAAAPRDAASANDGSLLSPAFGTRSRKRTRHTPQVIQQPPSQHSPLVDPDGTTPAVTSSRRNDMVQNIPRLRTLHLGDGSYQEAAEGGEEKEEDETAERDEVGGGEDMEVEQDDAEMEEEKDEEDEGEDEVPEEEDETAVGDQVSGGEEMEEGQEDAEMEEDQDEEDEGEDDELEEEEVVEEEEVAAADISPSRSQIVYQMKKFWIINKRAMTEAIRDILVIDRESNWRDYCKDNMAEQFVDKIHQMLLDGVTRDQAFNQISIAEIWNVFDKAYLINFLIDLHECIDASRINDDAMIEFKKLKNILTEHIRLAQAPILSRLIGPRIVAQGQLCEEIMENVNTQVVMNVGVLAEAVQRDIDDLCDELNDDQQIIFKQTISELEVDWNDNRDELIDFLDDSAESNIPGPPHIQELIANMTSSTSFLSNVKFQRDGGRSDSQNDLVESTTYLRWFIQKQVQLAHQKMMKLMFDGEFHLFDTPPKFSQAQLNQLIEIRKHGTIQDVIDYMLLEIPELTRSNDHYTEDEQALIDGDIANIKIRGLLGCSCCNSNDVEIVPVNFHRCFKYHRGRRYNKNKCHFRRAYVSSCGELFRVKKNGVVYKSTRRPNVDGTIVDTFKNDHVKWSIQRSYLVLWSFCSFEGFVRHFGHNWVVDHLFNDPSDNHLFQLCPLPSRCNKQRRDQLNRNSTTGLTGVVRWDGEFGVSQPGSSALPHPYNNMYPAVRYRFHLEGDVEWWYHFSINHILWMLFAMDSLMFVRVDQYRELFISNAPPSEYDPEHNDLDPDDRLLGDLLTIQLPPENNVYTPHNHTQMEEQQQEQQFYDVHGDNMLPFIRNADGTYIPLDQAPLQLQRQQYRFYDADEDPITWPMVYASGNLVPFGNRRIQVEPWCLFSALLDCLNRLSDCCPHNRDPLAFRDYVFLYAERNYDQIINRHGNTLNEVISRSVYAENEQDVFPIAKLSMETYNRMTVPNGSYYGDVEATIVAHAYNVSVVVWNLVGGQLKQQKRHFARSNRKDVIHIVQNGCHWDRANIPGYEPPDQAN